MKERERLRDLVCLVADKDAYMTIQALLNRYQALGIRELTRDLHVHPDHDPGCRLRSADFLRPFSSRADHALVVFDLEGSGGEELTREEAETRVEGMLAANGWEDRAAAIALHPEVEIWVWSDSPHVDHVLGWQGRSPDLRSWLVDEGFLSPDQDKPTRPKEAMDHALRTVKMPHSSALFKQLAEKVSVNKCVDPAFEKLKQTLKRWFAERPLGGNEGGQL